MAGEGVDGNYVWAMEVGVFAPRRLGDLEVAACGGENGQARFGGEACSRPPGTRVQGGNVRIPRMPACRKGGGKGKRGPEKEVFAAERQENR